ncbi:MAG: carboxymuconolactone decarboxylase family protein [Methanomassiliicoccales archaeon]|jgi:AhpD family alkylhydroperoxidase|nr:carboxymuconolactone decarboxylase family protein [Methanomassiliicoccales archaeon]
MSLELIAAQQPEVIRALYRFKNEVFKDDHLTFKEKELIAVAVTAVLKCDECLELHANKALEAGATKDQVREALSVAMYLAGPSVIVGMPSINKVLS